ncbi:FUSC family protein [Nocardioides zeae]|uniref:FUSC family protein n=1 Tax=Nocardioides zeae TaxID=1457234 RepID=A0A6P0HP66_9ACTN|nr:hypothetical protein [Nocardioides zeae]NEN80428.1 hypothetical protein [Nocardioides zeae]
MPLPRPLADLALHPAPAVAAKAAVAAVLAYLAVVPWGGVASHYAYYAPLGAVVTVSTTTVHSVRTAVQSAVAIGLGAALAVAVTMTSVPTLAGIAAVVASGSLLSWWGRLGAMASWVPVSALFVLLIGGGDPGGYVLGYLGLTAVGAAVGVLVNVVLPSLPLATADAAQAELRALLADQLDDLADGLRQESLPRSAEWEGRARDLVTPARTLESLVARAAEAQRANWRARRRQDSARSTVTQGRALGWLSYEVEEILRTLARDEHADRDEVALGPLLRPAAADAFVAVAAVLRATGDDREPAYGAADAAVARFADAVRERQHAGADTFAASALVVATRRVLDAVDPRVAAAAGS